MRRQYGTRAAQRRVHTPRIRRPIFATLWPTSCSTAVLLAPAWAAGDGTLGRAEAAIPERPIAAPTRLMLTRQRRQGGCSIGSGGKEQDAKRLQRWVREAVRMRFREVAVHDCILHATVMHVSVSLGRFCAVREAAALAPMSASRVAFWTGGRPHLGLMMSRGLTCSPSVCCS